MKMNADKNAIGKLAATADRAFEESATPEERVLAKALDACDVPPVPKGTVMAIHLRARAEAAARRRAWRTVWAAAAALALLFGAWAANRQGSAGSGTVLAEVEAGSGTGDAEAAEYAQEEADWLSPYDEQFTALESTLLAFESMDFETGDSAFPSL